MQPLLSLSGVTKRFGSVTVLQDVALTVMPGQVHGLLGENGAGKSTLLNILSGVLPRSSGEITIDGATVQIASPRDAAAAGIAMIHQELQQVPELSVAQNIFLGASLRRMGGVPTGAPIRRDPARAARQGISGRMPLTLQAL
jgi:ribose transport system ATP-binding protein